MTVTNSNDCIKAIDEWKFNLLSTNINDENKDGMQQLKQQRLLNILKKNAFQIIPLKFDKYQYEFVEHPDESIVLYADNASDEK